MKKLKLFTALLLLTTITTTAQITKGNWMVGGNGSFSYNKSETKNTSGGLQQNSASLPYYYVVLEPNVGYFFLNNFSTGMKFNYTAVFSEGQTFSQEAANISVAPFVRYYFLKDVKTINLFFEPSYYYTFGNIYTSYSTMTRLKFGTVAFLNNSVGIEAGLSYDVGSTTQNNFQRVLLGFGLQIHLEK
jgi:hypothetical protein